MNTQSEAWNKIADKVNFTLEPDLRTFQDHTSKTDRILDYGCGYGRTSLALHNLGYPRIIGYDTSSDIVARGKAQSPFLTLYAYSHPTLPEADGSFDAVICVAVMTCLPEAALRQAAMKEIRRILKTGGLLYMAEFLRTTHGTYNQGGVFVSDMGITMKHYYQAELQVLVQDFSEKYSSTIPALSLSGEPASAYHYFGIKTG